MRKRIPIAAALALTVIAAPAAASAQPTDPPPLDTEMLETQLKEFAALGDHSVVAEVRSGDETWSGTVGPRGMEEGAEDLEPDDRVRIASLSKSMLSTVLLQLEAEGEVDLEAPIDEYLPGLIPYESSMPTVRQLLQHTGGLFDYFPYLYASLYESGDLTDFIENHETHYTPEELVAIGTQDPQLFEPGTDWSYSNAGYVALGMLVEEITGNSLGHELTHRVFEPVGMDDTYQPHENSYGLRGDHPVPYVTTGDAEEPYLDSSALSNTQLWSAGAVVSTVGDVNDFYDALADGTLLEREQQLEMIDFTPTGVGYDYGLGLIGLPMACPGEAEQTFVGHTGGGLGHQTYSFHSVDGERQITFTWNVDDWHGYSNPEEFNQAVGNLVVAGLCGIDAGGAQTLRAQDLPDFAAMSEQTRIG
jgi:D-alanyl-D-alanine carboxypeptidase